MAGALLLPRAPDQVFEPRYVELPVRTVAGSFKTGRRRSGRVVVMEQKLNVLTLGVRDLDASRRFFVDGLGWKPHLDVPGEVIFLQVGHGFLLSLWDREAMAAEVGEFHRGGDALPITLAHNVDSDEEVTAVLDRATAAGGSILVPATRRDWGGVSGYFADPDGFRWEVAHNPGLTFSPDGTITFAPPSE
ncbi:VOC family protein [Cryptosporangium sp. NPDC048952]|uniref:VOC family protein n=1 Tax=Cryptosporangium sp. NPDC048952 TaxID=3363961 RepID=UPI00371810FD